MGAIFCGGAQIGGNGFGFKHPLLGENGLHQQPVGKSLHPQVGGKG